MPASFPQTSDRKWKVSPNGDPNADLILTRSVNLKQANRISIARKPVVILTDSDAATFGLLLSVTSDENGYYFITNSGIFSTTSFSVAPTFNTITTTGAPNISLGRDGVMFNGLLHVGGGAEVKFLQSGAWNTTFGAGVLDNAYPIRLANFENKINLAVGNKNKVYLYDTSYALQTTLTIPVEHIVSWMVWRQNNLYIGTRNISGGTAKMFVWTGLGTAAQYGFGVQADWIYSGAEYDSAVVIVTSAGQLMRFNGGGFDEMANFPVYDTPYSWSSSSSLINGTGKMASRGMIAIGKRLILNIDGSVTVSGAGYPGMYLPQQPSGMWEYTPSTGLTHRGGLCHTKYKNVAITEVASSALVVSSVHNLKTGDAIYVNDSGSVGGIIANQTYFAIVNGTTSFQLALTIADAMAGNKIPLTGTAGTAAVCFDPAYETGATLITAPGAVGTLNKNVMNTFFASDVFFGGETPNDAGTNAFMLMSFGLGRNVTQIATPPIYTGNPTDTFGQLVAWISNMVNDFEYITLKSRARRKIAFPTLVTSGVSNVTWVTSQQFTAPASERDLNNVVQGNEVTILRGAGSGYTAHVVSCVLAAGVWTVTLDKVIGNIVVGNMSEVQFDNWTKESTVNNTGTNLVQGYANMNIDSTSAWLEMKLELGGRDVSVDRFSLSIKANKKPK